MFLKLHYFDGGTAPAPALVNVTSINVVNFKPAEESRGGATYAAATVHFQGGGAREFILAEVEDGSIVADLTPADFESALVRAQSAPGVHDLHR